MPNTKKNEIQSLKLILAHWESYKNEDKFFIYNPYTQKFILGIKKSANFGNAPYIFYPLTFLDNRYEDQAKAFEYYYIIENNNTIYNSFDTQCNNLQKNIKAHQENLNKIKHNIVRHNDDYEHWQNIFYAIQEKIAQNDVTKVVAARKIKFTCDDGFDFPSIMLNLFEKNINSYVFAYEANNKIFLGASPELLVEKQSDQIKSFALAGTVIKSDEDVHKQGQDFLHDEKNIYEHNIVIESISQSMQKLGKNIKISKSHILELKNILHIKTDICATETNNNKQDTHNILQWVKELHPTPALGGSPKHTALKFIEQYENFDRGHYGAPFGVVDADGNGFFIVAIRSASIENNTLTAFAGCGIVDKSDCLKEYEEIDHKLTTIIEAL